MAFVGGIFGAVLLGAGALGAGTSVEPRNAMEEYAFCVWNSSKEFASTKETPDIIVEAATARCLDLRSGAIEWLVANARQKGPTDMLSDSDMRRTASEALDSVTRSKAVLFIVEARSKAN